jgi:iron complex outermembrane receptor protein
VNETNVQGEPKGSTTLPTEIFGATLFNRQEEGRLEWAQPRSKFTLGALYRGGKFGGNVRVTRFGDTKSLDQNTEQLDESFRAKFVTDLSFNYQINRILQVTVGANNLFDVYPDPLKAIQYPTPNSPTSVDNSSFGRFVYSRNVTQFGFNGGYYFISLSARL